MCQLDIASGDQFVKCPQRGTQSHRDHLLELIKIRGLCPNCRQRLKETDIG
nr:hypothetical protein [Candidatus Freyarchaeota archaeon]